MTVFRGPPTKGRVEWLHRPGDSRVKNPRKSPWLVLLLKNGPPYDQGQNEPWQGVWNAPASMHSRAEEKEHHGENSTYKSLILVLQSEISRGHWWTASCFFGLPSFYHPHFSQVSLCHWRTSPAHILDLDSISSFLVYSLPSACQSSHLLHLMSVDLAF